MADTPKTAQDFDNMSDEDFAKLDEADFSGNVEEGESDLTGHAPQLDEGNADAENNPDPDDNVDSNNTGDNSQSDESNTDTSTDGDAGTTEEETKSGDGGIDSQSNPMAGEGESTPEEDTAKSGEQPGTDTQEKGKDSAETGNGGGDGSVKDSKDTPAKAGYFKLPEGTDTAKVEQALDFFNKISVPFKADGRDFTVRSPEDAIRLMQQGVNYSRRMQELKPMKALNRVLQDNGLADQQKLSFAIDLLSGNKQAITQLLKSHKIDPMDLDTDKDSGYQATNYGGSTQENAFRDALEEAVTTPEGQALVTDIHQNWDTASKAKLRDNPAILGNLAQLKSSGVYDKVAAELQYQQSMGYLVGVPFLQAFDQVGEAMKNAGVFDAPEKPPAASGNPMAPLNTGQPSGQPVASGARKQNPPAKKAAANPHLSSTPPSKQTGNQQNSGQTDFSKMSDEEFLKMAPPE